MTEQKATPNPAAAGAGDAATQIPNDGIAQRLQQALAGDQAGAGDASGKVGTPEEISVDWGGTPKKVKVAELVAAAMKQDELKTLETALERKLKLAGNLDNYKQLQDTIEKMSPVQQEKLRGILMNPSVLDGEGDQDGDDIDDMIDDAVGGTPKKGGRKPDPMSQELNQLKQVVRGLVDIATTEHQQRQQKTVTQQIDSALDQFQVFKVADKMKPGSSAFIKQSVAAMHAADPSIGLDKLAAQAAQFAQQLVDGAAGGVLGQVTDETPAGVSLPGRKFTGADLASGNIRQHVLDLMNGARR